MVLAAKATTMIAADQDPRPVQPPRPDASDCCGGGCNPCVFEYYENEMDLYRAELLAWEERQAQAAPVKQKKGPQAK